MNFKNWSLRRLALTVGDHLRRRGVETVLTGGACVSIHSRNRFASFDLDFVLMAAEDRRPGRLALEELGFRKDGRHFRHPDTPYLVEFLLPPVSIGSEPILHPAEIRSGPRLLKLLSPTDCVKDRLAAYFFWNDRLSLAQALGVAARNAVDFPDIRRWAKSEGMDEKFLHFKKLAAGARKTGPGGGAP
jgi:hypothetical protein